MTQLNLPDDDVVRLLHSLSCAKYNILVKAPSNRAISPNDVFLVNHKFTDEMRRIKVFQVFPADKILDLSLSFCLLENIPCNGLTYCRHREIIIFGHNDRRTYYLTKFNQYRDQALHYQIGRP